MSLNKRLINTGGGGGIPTGNNNILFTTSRLDNTITVLDIQDPLSPVLISQFTHANLTAPYAIKLDKISSIGYVSITNGILAFDFSDLSNLTYLSSLTNANARAGRGLDIDVTRSIAYTNGATGIVSWNISNPLNIQLYDYHSNGNTDLGEIHISNNPNYVHKTRGTSDGIAGIDAIDPANLGNWGGIGSGTYLQDATGFASSSTERLIFVAAKEYFTSWTWFEFSGNFQGPLGVTWFDSGFNYNDTELDAAKQIAFGLTQSVITSFNVSDTANMPIIQYKYDAQIGNDAWSFILDPINDLIYVMRYAQITVMNVSNPANMQYVTAYTNTSFPGITSQQSVGLELL